MQKSIIHKGVPVVYDDWGEGKCIFLIHGYLETRKVWSGFAERFTGTFRVIAMDLPGHGDSGVWGEVHLMEDLAGAARDILEAEAIDRTFLVGHSLGGYVAMAFAELYPERLSGYCLFHSSCFADTEEKKQNRDREIHVIRCGKKRQIINTSIPKMFADSNLKPMEEKVERVKQIAMGNSEEGIVALLNGMKQRPDRTGILRNDKLPLLLIGGMKDNYIPEEVFEKLTDLAPRASVLRLEHSGHMGFLEEPGPAARAIREKVLSLIAR